MIRDRIDASPDTNDGENWHCPDCQSWGPFAVDVMTRVKVTDEGTPFLDDEGDLQYDDMSFAMCLDCQRQAPVADFRCVPAIIDKAERHARARWTRHGVDHATQARLWPTSRRRLNEASGLAHFKYHAKA